MTPIHNKSDLILFFQETWKRLNEKSPKFFRVIGWISIVMAGIGFIPDFLTWMDIKLPERWMAIVGKCMIAAGAWGKITSAMAVNVPTSEIMPFTVKKQVQQQIKEIESK